MEERRTITVGNETWFAPACRACGRSAYTGAVHVRSTLLGAIGPSADFRCDDCERSDTLGPREVYDLREPQRLADRMAKVKAGAW